MHSLSIEVSLKAAAPYVSDSLHPFRMQDLNDIRAIQELLGHIDLSTTMIYTHVLARPDIRIVSPLDRLCAEVRSLNEPTVAAVAKVDVERVETTEVAVVVEEYAGVAGFAGLSPSDSGEAAEACTPTSGRAAEACTPTSGRAAEA